MRNSSQYSASTAVAGELIIGLFGAFAKAAGDALQEDIRSKERQSVQDREDSKWNQRKYEALANIERGLCADHSRFHVSENSKQRTADRLRMEIEQYCRERRDILLQYTEKQIVSFVNRGTV